MGERWRTERWDSLHLLTPNWMTRLPGWQLPRPDPDGFLSAGEFVDHLEEYAASFDAPVADRHDGRAPADEPRRRRVRRPHGPRDVARATRRRRHRPARLAVRARRVGDADVRVLTADRYRNPGQLPAGWRPRRRRLGVRRADRRRARPVRPRGRPGGRAAHPDAAPLPRDGHLLVAGVDRPARAHHRRDARPRGRPARAVAAAGRTHRVDEVDSDVDLAALQRRGVRLAGRLAEPGRSDGRVRRRPAADHGGRRPATCTRFLDSDRRLRRPGRPDPRGAGAGPPDRRPRVRRAVPARPARRGDRDGRARDRLPPRPPLAATCRSSHADGSIRQYRGRDRRARRLHRRPALPAPPRLRRSSTGPATTRTHVVAPPDGRRRADAADRHAARTGEERA